MKRLLHWMCRPVHWIVEKLAFKYQHHNRIAHCIIGAVVAAGGVWIAYMGHTHHIMALDYLGYWVHGFGGAPIAKVIFEYLEVEG